MGLWLTSIGLTGPVGAIVGFIATKILESVLDKGILKIDLTIDSIKVAMQEEQYKKLAEAAYGKATARVYTEVEKDAIRKQYLDALRDFARFGNGLSDNNT